MLISEKITELNAKIKAEKHTDKLKTLKDELKKLKQRLAAETKAFTKQITDSTQTFATDAALAPFIVHDVAAGVKRLKECKQEIALIPIDAKTRKRVDVAISQDLPHLFAQYNNAYKPEYQVAAPTKAMVTDPDSHRKEWDKYVGKGPELHAGSTTKWGQSNLAGGMVNHYNGATHRALASSPVVSNLFTELTGTPKWRLRSNRFRIQVTNIGKDLSNTTHLEGPDVGEDTACDYYGIIVALSSKRSFVFWEGTARDKTLRADIKKYYKSRGGPKSKFILVPPRDMASKPYFKGRRRRLIFDGRKYILIFNSAVMHEVDTLVASTSLFLSPFDPEGKDNEFHESKTQLAKRTDRGRNYNPVEYVDGMTNRQTEIFGLAYGLAGAYWPSRKEVFTLVHQSAMQSGQDRAKSEYLVSKTSPKGKTTTNVRFKLPSHGKVNQRAPGYRAALRAAGMTELPDAMFAPGVPRFVFDLLAIFKGKPMLQYRFGLRKKYPKKSSQQKQLAKIVAASHAKADAHGRLPGHSKKPSNKSSQQKKLAKIVAASHAKADSHGRLPGHCHFDTGLEK